jgi:hypothetical protein
VDMQVLLREIASCLQREAKVFTPK